MSLKNTTFATPSDSGDGKNVSFKTYPVLFAGAGPGSEDLITLRGDNALRQADFVLYAGSLVNPKLLTHCRPECKLIDSSRLTLDEQMSLLLPAWKRGLHCVRLHSGDPSLYGAIREQIRVLRKAQVPFEIIPGVSAVFAAAAALGTELTLPGISQSLVLTRSEGRTPLPRGQQPAVFAKTGATLAFYLSAAHFDELTKQLLEKGNLAPDTPTAVVSRATWQDECIIKAPLANIAAEVSRKGFRRQALLLVGQALNEEAEVPSSRLYSSTFSHGYRDAGGKNFHGAVALWTFSQSGVIRARDIAAALGKKQSKIFFPQPGMPELVRSQWTHFDGHVFIGACGIAVRLCAPLLRNKAIDPAVVCIDAEGRFTVSLAAGHLGGANRLCRRIAAITGGEAVISTGTDGNGIIAFDEAAAIEGARIIDTQAVLACNSAILAGRDVTFYGPQSIFQRYWQDVQCIHFGGSVPDNGNKKSTTKKSLKLNHDIKASEDAPIVYWDTTPLLPRSMGSHNVLVISSKTFVLGVGCRQGTSAEAMLREAMSFLCRHSITKEQLAACATLDIKRDEPAVTALARKLGVPVHYYTAQALADVPGCHYSPFVAMHTGTGSVCEAACLLCAGSNDRIGLLAEKEKADGSMTFALARIPHGHWCAETKNFENHGSLYPPCVSTSASGVCPPPGGICVAGLGSCKSESITPQVRAALAAADTIVGYEPYLKKISELIIGKIIITSGMRTEVERCTIALEAAMKGNSVCVVSSGDAGILAMAGLLYELKFSNPRFAGISVQVLPGVTAASLAAARLGAPLQNGFSLISLSDLLVPQNEIRANLAAAAEGNLPVTLYNPAGKKRRAMLAEALDLFSKKRGATTPCALVRHAGQDNEAVWLGLLKDFPKEDVDMSTIVLIGGLRTKIVNGVLFEARGYADKYSIRQEKTESTGPLLGSNKDGDLL